MTMVDLILSSKYKEFLKHKAKVEFLEGTTSAGKTTVGIVKFMFEVAESPKKLHIMSGLDLGTIEKNIIQKELGVIDVFGKLVSYHSKGNKDHALPHLKYVTKNNGEKIIYVLGYDNQSRWKKVLGGQYGCLYIDEINIANMEYVREVTMRADYMLATLNPDDPELQIYHEFINRSRPLEKYKNDAPDEINKQLNQEPEPGWVHWFFSFDHNAGLSEEKKKQIISTVPKGTKLYKNKILGLRGRAEGLIFGSFEYDKNVITEQQAKMMNFVSFSCGVDTSYSKKTDDTVSFIFQGLTDKGELVILEEKVMNNKTAEITFSPSDVAQMLFAFIGYCTNKWGFSQFVFIDNADQATVTEVNKLKRNLSSLHSFVDSDKTVKIINRINLMNGWIHNRQYLIVKECVNHIREVTSYSFEKGVPEDRNDHTINASQYGWIPIRTKIGFENQKPNVKRKIRKAKQLFGR